LTKKAAFPALPIESYSSVLSRAPARDTPRRAALDKGKSARLRSKSAGR
jgi:hypothetical protein